MFFSKRKIEDFLLTLDGFKTSASVVDKFKGAAPKFRSEFTLLNVCSFVCKSIRVCLIVIIKLMLHLSV